MQQIAIIGFGFMGQMHAQALQLLPEATLSAVVSSSADKTRAALDQLGSQAPLYPSLDALLAEAPATDAVIICLPTPLHRATALMAIRAGKHVLCEKPLALTLDDADAIVRAAEQSAVKFQVGHCLRFWPEYQAFTQFFRGRIAGKLLSLSLQRRSARTTWSRDGWMADPARSGGAALDLHIHDTDYILHLLGRPRSVTSTGTRDQQGWSHLFTHYEFADGPAVTAEGGNNYPPQWGFQMAFQAVFDRGAVEYDSRATPTLAATLGNTQPQPIPFDAPTTGQSKSQAGNISSLGGYYNQLAYFVDCLERDELPKQATAAQARTALEITLAEIRSAEQRQTIRL